MMIVTDTWAGIYKESYPLSSEDIHPDARVVQNLLNTREYLLNRMVGIAACIDSKRYKEAQESAYSTLEMIQGFPFKFDPPPRYTDSLGRSYAYGGPLRGAVKKRSTGG